LTIVARKSPSRGLHARAHEDLSLPRRGPAARAAARARRDRQGCMRHTRRLAASARRLGDDGSQGWREAREARALGGSAPSAATRAGVSVSPPLVALGADLAPTVPSPAFEEVTPAALARASKTKPWLKNGATDQRAIVRHGEGHASGTAGVLKDGPARRRHGPR
jgi:hypothetical protein